MSEWKGPWKCEKCGKHWEWRPGQLSPSGHMGLSGAFYCTGEVVPHDRRAPDPLLGLLREAREALKALLVMMDRGDKPRKLDETLTWVQNDLKARAMASGALTRLDASLAEAPKAGEGSRADSRAASGVVDPGELQALVNAAEAYLWCHEEVCRENLREALIPFAHPPGESAGEKEDSRE